MESKLAKYPEDLKRLRSQILQRHETDQISLEYQLKLAPLTSRLAEGRHQLDYSLTTRLDTVQLEKETRSNEIRKRSKTTSLARSIAIVGRALIEYSTCDRLTEARAAVKYARALSQYYKALIIDKISRSMLDVISDRLQVDRDFRFRLERPIKLRMIQGSLQEKR